MRVSLLTSLLILLLDASSTKIFDPTALPAQIAETAVSKIFVKEASGRSLGKTCRKLIGLYTDERCFKYDCLECGTRAILSGFCLKIFL